MMATDLKTYELAARPARSGDDPLAGFLRAARRAPVALSVGSVRQIDAMRLQILLAARLQWRADGVALRLVDNTDAFRAGLQRLGLAPDFFEEEAP